MQRLTRPVLVAAIVVLVLSGCAASGGESVGGDASVEQHCTSDNVGGSITHGSVISPKGLDPLGPAGGAVSGGTELQALFDTLVVYDMEAAEYKPQVAESLTPNEDFTIWTLVLRDGVKYGNGDAVIADDVKASIERHISSENTQSSRGEAILIQEIEVLDDRTLTFAVDASYPDFPRVLATDVGMITNPRVLAERGAEEFALDPSGAGVGPFELERYAPGDEIVMTAKDDYWGGPVCVETLRFISIASADATLDALMNSELDVAYLRDPFAVHQAREAGFQSLPTFFNYGEGVLMNSAESSPTSDVRIRLAVVAAIDPDAINERVFDGVALATSGLVHHDTPGVPGGTEGPSYDPDLARELVAEAKADGWDGTIRLHADNAPARVEEAIAVGAVLEDVGFTVELDTVQSLAEIITRVVVDRDYDLVLWGSNLSVEGMWRSLNTFVHGDSPSNYYGYSDPRINEHIEALRTAETLDDKRDILVGIQEALVDNPYFANIAALEEDNLHSPRVRGLELSSAGILRYDKAFITDHSP